MIQVKMLLIVHGCWWRWPWGWKPYKFMRLMIMMMMFVMIAHCIITYDGSTNDQRLSSLQTHSPFPVFSRFSRSKRRRPWHSVCTGTGNLLSWKLSLFPAWVFLVFSLEVLVTQIPSCIDACIGLRGWVGANCARINPNVSKCFRGEVIGPLGCLSILGRERVAGTSSYFSSSVLVSLSSSSSSSAS